MAKAQKPCPVPRLSKAEIVDFLADAPGRVGKREIARAFGIKGGLAKVELKRLLKEMAEDGLIQKRERKVITRKGELPSVTVLDITGLDIDGELVAQPVNWDDDTPPQVLIIPGQDRDTPPTVGDRVLVRIRKTGDDQYPYDARIIRRIGKGLNRILGVYRKADRASRVIPAGKRSRHEYIIKPGDQGDAKNGDLVRIEAKAGSRFGAKEGRVVEVLGARIGDPRTISLIAVHEHGLPVDFDNSVLKEARKARPAPLKNRTEMRDIPLITIDPADARDHDDAVWAAADDDPANEGGYKVIVAIADVAHYVRSGSSLDRSARERGNSAYFPDRVVPMLPEELSTDLCSLREGEDRACLAVEMIIGSDGRKKRHAFIRGLMRSAGKLSYEEAQEGFEQHPGDKAAPLMHNVLLPLYAAYSCVLKARAKRAPLELDLPEHRIELDTEGNVQAVRLRERFDAHKLIEEFMILANVCAAETLERKKSALIYRVHDGPNREKLTALKDFLTTLGLKLALGQVIQPKIFNQILAKARHTEYEEMVSTLILRSQAQAVYSPDNLSHFGLNLGRYAHFTSPIRRYADLIVHRALIRANGFGDDGLSDEETDRIHQIARHISMTERRAMAAERDSNDHYIAAYMEDRIGAKFMGRISSVTRFGLFIRLDETGADGLVPISTLPDDYYHHDETAHSLVGEKTGRTLRLGEIVEVSLAEATPLTGGLRFELLEGGTVGKPVKLRRGKGRPPRGKR